MLRSGISAVSVSNKCQYCSYQLLVGCDKVGLSEVHQLDSDVEGDRYKIVEKQEKNETGGKGK